MDDQTQAEVYAGADFEQAHTRIVQAFDTKFPRVELQGKILDLGCGPGDITFRFAARFPNSYIIGVDGSRAMISLANERRADESQLRDRVTFIEGLLPGAPIPPGPYSAIVSNSLLHHLHHPDVLWQTVSQHASPGTKIFIADLFRPMSEENARQIVDEYSADEPEILRRDFYNSLLAAFEPKEIRQQLAETGLTELEVEKISDRHVLVFGDKG
jgi:ubiquinone/menaquinone biosynthesis C-methylase UbiE